MCYFTIMQYNKKEKRKIVKPAEKLIQGRFPLGSKFSRLSIPDATIRVDPYMYKMLVDLKPYLHLLITTAPTSASASSSHPKIYAFGETLYYNVPCFVS